MWGMGTFGSDRFTPDEVSAAVGGAIRCGYRLFDCAACYGNEDQIGEVFQQAFAEGVVERKDLFIMTKVWNDMHDRVEESCRKSIADLVILLRVSDEKVIKKSGDRSQNKIMMHDP